MYTIITITREEARDALRDAFIEKYPEHTAVLSNPETVFEIQQADGGKDEPVHAEARWQT